MVVTSVIAITPSATMPIITASQLLSNVAPPPKQYEPGASMEAAIAV